MKKNAFLVNTSRGMIIDNSALYQALKEGIISGAAVDVYNPEPINPGDPILSLDNFIITPHLWILLGKIYQRSQGTKSALNVAEGS